MSQETPIGNLSGGISEEDAKLVDSILNDLGQGSQQAPQGSQGSQAPMSPEQQALLAQQQALQQQALQQQAMQGQSMQQAIQGQAIQGQSMQVAGSSSQSIAESIKRESKSIMVIIVLCVLLNLGQVNNLFKKIALFVSEDGSLNLQCVFVKAILIGALFFVAKSKL